MKLEVPVWVEYVDPRSKERRACFMVASGEKKVLRTIKDFATLAPRLGHPPCSKLLQQAATKSWPWTDRCHSRTGRNAAAEFEAIRLTLDAILLRASSEPANAGALRAFLEGHGRTSELNAVVDGVLALPAPTRLSEETSGGLRGRLLWVEWGSFWRSLERTNE